MRSIGIGLSLLFASTSFALPPGETRFRNGANHHLGDDSFVAAFGRAPGINDSEHDRMRVHLEHVRAWLADRPATKPELEARRAELLEYLGDYIDNGTTPKNTSVDWRSPVFIDFEGNICAVGYLIERSVGRALPETIAANHRHAFLEDIAAAMPQVREWVASSGFTLDELASIQPCYTPPTSEHDRWSRWDLAGLYKAVDGTHRDRFVKHYIEGGPLEITTTGSFHKLQMDGVWKREAGGRVIGNGTMKAGAGAWTSFYASGKQMARGQFVANQPHGEWKLFHESGNVAAIGQFHRGNRSGAWTFFHDMPKANPIAKGTFTKWGSLTGTWRHYDEAGKLIANVTINRGSGHQIAMDAPGFRYEANVDEMGRIEAFIAPDLRLFVNHHYGSPTIFDDNGMRLANVKGMWRQANCGWGTKRKRLARAGDVDTLQRLLDKDASGDDKCTNPVPVTAARAERIEELFATIAVESKPAAWLEGLIERRIVGDAVVERAEPIQGARDTSFSSDGMRGIVAGNIGVFAEWPHVDGHFDRLYYTLAGSAFYDSYDDTTRVYDEKLAEQLQQEEMERMNAMTGEP